MSNFPYMLSRYAYKSKPGGSTVGYIRNQMRPCKSSEEGLARAISACHAWIPAVMLGRQIRDNWVCQQLIGLDFDSKSSYVSEGDAISRLEENGIFPALSYDTYSSTAENPRFRIVLVLDEPCEDPDVMEMAIEKLLLLFPEADQSCRDLSRLFYGAPGLKSVRKLFNRPSYKRCNIRTILKLEVDVERKHDELDEGKRKKRYRGRMAIQAVTAEKLDKLKGSFDLLKAIQDATGERGCRYGSYVRFRTCPICGHRDCFAYYPDTDTWSCFSTSNTTGIRGGDSIAFFMARDGLSFREAVAVLEEDATRTCG